MALIHMKRVLEATQIPYKYLDLYTLTCKIFLPNYLGTGNSPTTILNYSSSS